MNSTHRIASPRAFAASFSFMAVSMAFFVFPDDLLFELFLVFFVEDVDDEAPPRTETTGASQNNCLEGNVDALGLATEPIAAPPHEQIATTSKARFLPIRKAISREFPSPTVGKEMV